MPAPCAGYTPVAGWESGATQPSGSSRRVVSTRRGTTVSRFIQKQANRGFDVAKETVEIVNRTEVHR